MATDPNTIWENFGYGPKPCVQQQKPAVLTDEELRQIDENDLTAEECDRLDELEVNDLMADERAFNATLPKGCPAELDHGPDVSTTEMIERDDMLKFAQTIRDHEAKEARCGVHLVAPEHIQLTIDARRRAKEEGNCEDGYGDTPMSDMVAELGDDGPYNGIDGWRDGVSIETPAGLRIKAMAAFTAGLDDELTAEKDCVGADEGCQCEDCRYEDDAAEWAAEERRHQAEREEECPTTRRVRDCDIPATLRAIELPATEDHNSYRLWFDGEDEMQQFLAGRCLYASDDRSIKDREGDVVGMWFYAHFGPTPVS